MKVLKFAPHLIPSIFSGEKTSTWRLFDDKNLSLEDDLVFKNSENGEIIGHGKIISFYEKELQNISGEDYNGHEKFENTDQMLEVYRGYYGNKVDYDSVIKIIKFSFKKI